MKEVVIIFKRSLFSDLLLSAKKELEVICGRADRVLSCEDAIMIHWNNIEWLTWNDDYIHLMNMISKLDIQDVSKFHYLEWDEEANHEDQMGEFFDNPWKITLAGRIKYSENEKKLDLRTFF